MYKWNFQKAESILETFEGKNLCEFRGFVAICKSFLHEIWGCDVLRHGTSEQSVKVFSAKITNS